MVTDNNAAAAGDGGAVPKVSHSIFMVQQKTKNVLWACKMTCFESHVFFVAKYSWLVCKW